MKAVDWSKWSSIAEISSAIAILVTLLYLGVQTRYVAEQTQQNTQAINATAMQGVAQIELQAIGGVLEHPDVLLSLNKTTLTNEEASRLYSFLTAITRSREAYYALLQLGVIDQAAYERFEEPLVFILGIDRIRNFWSNQSGGYNADFVAHVNSRIANQPVSPPGGEDFIQGIFRASPSSQ